MYYSRYGDFVDSSAHDFCQKLLEKIGNQVCEEIRGIKQRSRLAKVDFTQSSRQVALVKEQHDRDMANTFSKLIKMWIWHFVRGKMKRISIYIIDFFANPLNYGEKNYDPVNITKMFIKVMPRNVGDDVSPPGSPVRSVGHMITPQKKKKKSPGVIKKTISPRFLTRTDTNQPLSIVQSSKETAERVKFLLRSGFMLQKQYKKDTDTKFLKKLWKKNYSQLFLHKCNQSAGYDKKNAKLKIPESGLQKGRELMMKCFAMSLDGLKQNKDL